MYDGTSFLLSCRCFLLRYVMMFRYCFCGLIHNTYGVGRYSNQSLQSSFLKFICPNTSKVISIWKSLCMPLYVLGAKKIRNPIIQTMVKKKNQARRGDYQYEEKQPLSSTGFKKHVLEKFQIIGVQMCWEIKKCGKTCARLFSNFSTKKIRWTYECIGNYVIFY